MALDKLGPYRFKGVLGRGGMGVVYRGQHEETGEFHAVKVLSPSYSDDDHFRGRFESEIRALLKLNHQNIVQLISYGQEDGMLFFSMELVEGNSLFQMQRQGHRFDWREVLTIARDVCQGLRHAHDRGVIHRDLKPGNLLMANLSDADAADPKRNLPGIVKITDFGIAKSYGSSQNTGTNVLGTMDFMSPEQAKGEPTTGRSDLYSLGTVMFTLLAGKPPFTSKSVEEGIHNLIHVDPPLISASVPGVPPEIDDLIRGLMAKNPEERLPTTLALSRKLDELEDGLRFQAEAKTAEVSGSTIANPSHELLKKGKKAPTTDVAPGRHHRVGTKPRISGGRTAEYTDQDLDNIRRESEAGSAKPRLNRPLDKRDNYFNTVTEHLRKQQEGATFQTEEEKGQGKVPLLLALMAVLSVVAFGLYQVLTPPSADKLFEQIKAEERNPNEVLAEVQQFLDLYAPDDSRWFEVDQLGGIGRAIQFYNRLQARNTLNKNRLSLMEQDFLKIAERAESDGTRGNQEMAAFVTFHSNAADLSDSDQKVLEHAKSYQAKIRADARNTVQTNIKQIRSVMDSAQSKNPSEAMSIYQSIVKLYENVPWSDDADGKEGRRLVEEAGQLLDRGLHSVD